MSHRRTALALLALTGPVAAALVTATATSALASATWDGVTPADGAKVTSSSFSVRANVSSGSSSVTLTLTSAANGSSKACTVASSGGVASGAQTIKIDIPSSGACSTTRNTQWTATLSGGATGTRSFYTNVAPAAPTGFTASGSGARDVSFSWTKGSESDLSYALYEDGAVVDGSIPACSSGTCTYALYYSTDKPGDHHYELAAQRTSGGCSSCGSTVASASRASASATLVAPKPTQSPTPEPTSSPTPDPGTGGTTGGTTGDGSTGDGSTGGSTTGDGSTGGSTSGGSNSGGTSTSGGSTSGGTSTSGGSTSGGKTSTSGGTAVNAGPKPTLPSLDPIVAQRRAFALRFNAFSPSLGIPKLPPLPSITLPSTSGEAPLPLGTFNPQLPYQPVTETEKISDGTLARPVAAVRDVLDSDRLARSIAGALILLLIGAHLRRFLATQVDDQL